jgi:NitT/TauT family transport system substrate-binding protein
MKRRSILTSCPLFFLSLFVTVGCNNSSTSQSKAPVSPQPGDVKLGFSAWPGWFPWQVAQEKEIFARSKVGVNLKWFDSYTDSLAALNNGSLDANSQTLTDTISSIASGKDLVVVMTNDNSTGNDKIIISEQIKSVKDLKGKKVAAIC